ncbi:LbetaH domain-containing protein [Rickettsia canadensis]|uniref:Virginiamycin A acetyltransferase n=1 Tax=Rickettsia canadensis str. CA410 TaxID=1105107 RepID=A0ABM5MT27_RICCA|nr:virginiamycin A acetyltransferase [Rickettsia canadensis]AFB21176.1 virginiamycin A acetyltransferase [Rickettsia canadensis str. CA410]
MGTSFITDNINHPIDWFATAPFFIFKHGNNYTPSYDKRRDIIVVVGNDVCFGTNSTIFCLELIFGDGAIISACSVMAKDLPLYSIVTRNHAKVIHYRFFDKIIEQLLEIKWWNWDYNKITRNIPIFGADIEKLTQAE